jgi:uncharacterized membrane protein
MRCPGCGKTVDLNQDYCPSCGAKITRETGSSIARELDELDSRKNEDPSEEILRLKKLLIRMDERYNALEQALDKRLAALEQKSPGEAAEPKPPAESKTAETQREMQVHPAVAEGLPKAVGQTRPCPHCGRNVESRYDRCPSCGTQIEPPRRPEPKSSEWEAILGGNWLARVGVLALFVGLAFFIMFAIDKGWLGPPVRIALGIVAGLGMIGGGLYWQKRYPTLSQTLSGGGIALLYLSIFAAFAYFQMLNVYLAIGLLFVISAGSSALALKHNSLPLGLIGIMGAFAAPFVLGLRHAGEAGVSLSGTGSQLLIYIMVVDLGVIFLSTFHNWRWFTLVAFLGTALSFTAWQAQYGGRASLLLREGSLTLLFLIFVGATMLFHVVQRKRAQDFDYLLIEINAAAYTVISYALMWPSHHAWMGGFTILLALFYAGLGRAVRRRGKENVQLASIASGLALILLTLAIPVQFGNRAWTTVAWAAEGTILMWLAIRFGSRLLRFFGCAAFALMAVRLCALDSRLASYQPVMNTRTLAFVFSIAAVYLTGYILLRRSRSAGDSWTSRIGQTFLPAADLIALILVLLEVLDYRKGSWHSGWPLALLAIFSALPVLHYLSWRRSLMTDDDAIIMTASAACYLGISILVWDQYQAWMGALYLLLAVSYGVLSWIKLKTDRRSILGLYALGIALSFLTLAAYAQLDNRVWTTVVWSVEFVLLAWGASRFKIPIMRTFGLIAFALAGLRLLSFHTVVDIATYTPVLNPRALGFLVAIAAAYLGARIIGRIDNAAAPLLVVANFFTIWVASHEVWDYFGQRLRSAVLTGDVVLKNIQNLSLTALWALYAIILLAVGIAKRWRSLRLGALGLFGLAVGKVFLYDVWALQTIYRVAAFTGLGILLIAGGYLYQRNSRVILGFFALKESSPQDGKGENEQR